MVCKLESRQILGSCSWNRQLWAPLEVRRIRYTHSILQSYTPLSCHTIFKPINSSWHQNQTHKSKFIQAHIEWLWCANWNQGRYWDHALETVNCVCSGKCCRQLIPKCDRPGEVWLWSPFGTHTHNSKNFQLKNFNGEQPAMSTTGTTIQALYQIWYPTWIGIMLLKPSTVSAVVNVVGS
jgi:hypothetical protein